jgi:hypothetical protein
MKLCLQKYISNYHVALMHNTPTISKFKKLRDQTKVNGLLLTLHSWPNSGLQLHIGAFQNNNYVVCYYFGGKVIKDYLYEGHDELLTLGGAALRGGKALGQTV